MTAPLVHRERTTAEKITVCKANIEIAKAYAEYFASMEHENLAAKWKQAAKLLDVQLYNLKKQQQTEGKTS